MTSAKSEFENFLKDVQRFQLPGQTESKSLLHWFLFNVFRLDETASRDAICDGKYDKGIDGVWVDDDSEEIIIFQSKFTKDPTKTLGDTDLKDFVGSANWFAKPENLDQLLSSSANDELKALVSRLDLAKAYEGDYDVKLIFVTSRTLDKQGSEFLEATKNTNTKLEVWHQPLLLAQHSNLVRKTRVTGKHKFETTVSGFEYNPKGKIRVHVRPVRASDIAAMHGVADRSLFALNVRAGLGRTRVNRDLEKALEKADKHHQFILFHNGVTIICRQPDRQGT